MVPQAFGRDTVFGDRSFRIVANGPIVLSLLLAVPILAFTNFSPVQLALVVPAVNGVIFGGIVILTFLLALLTGQSLTEMISTLV